MAKLLREPLLHFLVLGAVLFGAYGLFNPNGPEDAQTIVVDRQALLTYSQYRAKAFDKKRFGAMLDGMPEPELEKLIADYVREEALYREAKALALDKHDYVAKLRLIGQLEFLAGGLIANLPPLQEQEIEAYFKAHQHDYRVPATITFTHVFFNEARHGAKAESLACGQLEELNAAHAAFTDAVGHGERFLYHLNYVQKERELIASHFGDEMATAVFALEPDATSWRGPFRSPYGWHAVMVTDRSDARIPPLSEVRARVAADAETARREARMEKTKDGIVAAYKVRVLPIRANNGKAGP